MLAVELQPLRVWKACFPHPTPRMVERAPSKGTSTEEVAAKPWGKKETSCRDSRGWRKQQKAEKEGRKEGRERRMGSVEMEGMLFSAGRKT